jgi:hypothetical protein
MPLQASASALSNAGKGLDTRPPFWMYNTFGSDVNSAGQGVMPNINGKETYISKYEGLSKIAYDGTILWTRSVPGGQTRRIEVDSSGNVYAEGGVRKVTKFSPEGDIIWTSSVDQVSGTGDARFILDDVNGAVYISCTNESTPEAILVKVNASNGSIVWSRTASGTGVQGFGAAVDPSSNRVYQLAFANPGDSIYNAYVIAYNLNGTYQWQTALIDSSRQTSLFPWSIASNNGHGGVYVSTRFGNYAALTFKLNTSGSLTYGIYHSSSGFFQFPGCSVSPDNTRLLVSHYDASLNVFDASNGNQLFTRTINGGNVSAFNCAADDDNNLYIAAYNFGSPKGGVYYKLKSDGSGLGSYGAGLSLSASAGTGGYRSDATCSPYVTLGNLTIGSPSYTVTVTGASAGSGTRAPGNYNFIRTK